MTKEELLNKYEEFKNDDNAMIALHIHMPDDTIETIINRNAKNKMEYVKKTYNEALEHPASNDIYIVGADFSVPETDTFDFGCAIRLIQRNKRATRKAWGDNPVYIYYVPPGDYKPTTKAGAKYVNDDGLVPYGAYIAIKTINGNVIPFTPGQDSMIAEDWCEYKD